MPTALSLPPMGETAMTPTSAVASFPNPKRPTLFFPHVASRLPTTSRFLDTSRFPRLSQSHIFLVSEWQPNGCKGCPESSKLHSHPTSPCRPPSPRGLFLPLFWTTLLKFWAMVMEMAMEIAFDLSLRGPPATVVVLNSSLDSLESAQGTTLGPSPRQVLGLTLGPALCQDRG